LHTVSSEIPFGARLLARQALQEEDTPVATIAWRLGYASESAFSAAFKRSSGCAPGLYRQEQRAESSTVSLKTSFPRRREPK